MVMNVVTGSDDRFETDVVLVPGPAVENIWLRVIPVKAQESSFFIFTDLAKQLRRARLGRVEFRVILVRTYVMIQDRLEPLVVANPVQAEYPFHILRLDLEVLG